MTLQQGSNFREDDPVAASLGANNISNSELLIVCRVDVVGEEATAKTNNVGKLMDGGLNPGVPAAILVDVVKVDFIEVFKVELD